MMQDMTHVTLHEAGCLYLKKYLQGDLQKVTHWKHRCQS